jgi:hypothetical protein
VTVDLSTARTGDRVTFRYGGDGVVAEAEAYSDESTSLSFSGPNGISRSCFFNGGNRTAKPGDSFDIIELIPATQPEPDDCDAFYSNAAMWMDCFDRARQIFEGDVANICNVADIIFHRQVAAVRKYVEGPI